MSIWKKLFVNSGLLLGTLIVSTALFALDLHDAKEQGLVGETTSGYLEARVSGAETDKLVRDINYQRRAEYQRIADKNNISIADVEALAGKKAIEKTPAGQYIKLGGNWQQK